MFRYSCVREGMHAGFCYAILDEMAAFVFFFQAEDGIRGRNVTGVQTCALPISLKRSSLSPSLLGGDLPLTIGEISPERRADREFTGVREGLPTIRPALYSSGCNPPMMRPPQTERRHCSAGIFGLPNYP